MNYTSVEKIANIRLLLHKVLPAVYDESLSYLEGLAKLTFKVNETIDSVNVLNDNVELLNQSVEELNDRVTTVEGEIDGFEKEVIRRVDALEIELRASIDQAINDMETEVYGTINRLDARVTALEEYVHSTLDSLIAEIQKLVQDEIEKMEALYYTLEEDLRKYVDDTVNELIAEIPDLTNIYVIDPTSGELVKVQEAINNTFKFNLYYALTVDEFNSLGLTINELNEIKVRGVPRGMRCTEWLHDAKKVLLDQVDIEIAKNWVNPHDTARGYLNGQTVWLNDNIDVNESMWAWSGSYTANELVTLGFTVDEIIAFGMTAEDWVLRANTIMVA